MAVQTPYLHADGDINQSKRKRAGELPGIGDRVAQPTYDPNPSIRNAQADQDAAAQRNAVNGWPVPTGSNPARAQRMQEQYRNPVTGPRGVVQPASKAPGIADGFAGGGIGGAVERVQKSPANGGASVPARAIDLVKGTVGVNAGLLSAPVTATIDGIRHGLAYVTDSELTNPSAARDVTGKLMHDGIGNLSQAFDGTAETVRNMIGATPARPAVAAQAQPATSPAAGTAPAQPGSPQAPGRSATQVASGYTQTGTDGIVMRLGKDGTPEFTNDPAAVAGAQAMPTGGIGGRQAQQSAPGSMVAPAGSRVLASGSNTPDQEFARLGSVANLGNGLGTANFGNDGDSRLAMERFQRANDIRAQTIQDSRRGGIGEGGGQVTVVGDNSWLASRRAPTLAERQRARLDAMGAQTEAVRAGIQEAAATGADTRATNSLTRAKTQQDIETGALALQNAQTIQQLRALMADPSLTDAERQAAMQAYSAMTISPKDRYMTVEGGTNEFGGRDASRVFDRLTGQGIGAPSAALPAGVSREQALSQARAAIASGAPKDAVNRRLQDMGLDPI